MKLRDPDTRQAFKIELQNRFESLFVQEEREEEVRNVNGDGGEQAQDIDVNVQWEKIKKTLVDTCGSVLGCMYEKGQEEVACLTRHTGRLKIDERPNRY